MYNKLRSGTIKKQLLTTVLISALAINVIPVYAQMSPEASALYQEACSAEHQQDLKEAIAKLEQAIAISGGDAMLYTKLAGIYSEIDNYDKALEAYNKVVKLKPDDAFVYISIGSIYENQGKYKGKLTKESLKKIVNDSVSDTTTRSLYTTITTLIPVVCLIILGSKGILPFNIAIIIGLVAGFYSSSFLAPQLWYKIESKNLPIDERVSVKKKTEENQDVIVQENNKKTTKKKAKKKKNKK